MNKIISLNQLGNIKRGSKKLVLVGGCFDILHIGHLRFLQEAKKAGDILFRQKQTCLLVALESDQKTKTLKGKNRPIHSQPERAEILSSLEDVDYVLLLPYFQGDRQYRDLIKNIKPEIVAVTENDPIKEKKQNQAKMVGGKLVVIPKIKTPSTTQLTKLLGID